MGSESYLRPFIGSTARVFPTGLRPYRGQHDRGLRALRSLWDGFVLPFARAILPAVERAVDELAPDVLVADQQEPFPEHYALVGPAIGQRAPVDGFAWSALDPQRQLVLVSMGTLAQDLAIDFYGRAVEALRPLAPQVQAVLVAPPDAVAQPPSHILVTPRAPLLELLPRTAAVVCHGGINTTCEALAHGVPVLVAPIKHDQPVIAGQVARAGAGRRASFTRARPDQLRHAITSLLDDPAYRVAAARVAASFAAGGGAPAAADQLVRLAGRLTART